MNANFKQVRPTYFRGSPAKYPSIVVSIRSRIVSGELGPNARLPTWVELQRSFGATSATIRKALTQLTAEGFVEARGRSGAFVAAQPPHLHHYALLFHADPTDLEAGGWSHFFAALANEATKIQQAEHRQFECFYGINGPTDTEQYQRLISKVSVQRFAGLIFTMHPCHLSGTPLVELPGLPRVALTGDAGLQTIPRVYFDSMPWFEKAFDYLASCGRKRVAFVSKASPRFMSGWDYPPALLSARGLTTQPHWHVPLPVWSVGAQHAVQLLMRSEGARPDALVITDDNVVEPAVAGLMAAGVRVPEEVTVVAHANFPRSGPRVLPLHWLGHDNHAVLQACLNIIDQQRRGEKPPAYTRIAPVFEAELATRNATAELSPAEHN